jgi:hypothetical protein
MFVPNAIPKIDILLLDLSFYRSCTKFSLHITTYFLGYDDYEQPNRITENYVTIS